jgi:hypothetical protein
MTVPSQDVVRAIEAGITDVTRRVEIFESDGVTPFYPNGSEEDVFRLITGSVSIDSSRDERRTLDLTMDNGDNALRPNADQGFWYDKIIKPYRGVRYASSNFKPKVLIIEAPTFVDATAFKGVLYSIGFDDVTVNLNATSMSHLSGYTIIVSVMGSGTTAKATLLNSAFQAGFDIFTQGLGNGVGEIPWALTETAFTNAAPLSIIPTLDSPVSGGWSQETEGSGAGQAIVSISPSAWGAAYSLNNSVTHFTVSGQDNGRGRWVNYKPASYGSEARKLLSNIFRYLWNYTPYREWETSLGTFMIDNMKTSNFPHQLSLSGRDQTKRCLQSKLQNPVSFDPATKIVDLVRALGANAGVKNFKFDPSMNQTIGKTISAARGTERWATMEEALNVIAYDLYFDADGYLTATPWADPALGSPIASFKTGKGGNLASYDLSTNDSRIYNHTVVTGIPEASDSEALGFFGEAWNRNPASPTNIDSIGERTLFYTSTFFSSDAQCGAYANELLKQNAFEQYELNCSSYVYPWIEAGVVVDFLDPDRVAAEPTRFLGTQFTVPLSLDMMTGSGKRVVFIAGA